MQSSSNIIGCILGTAVGDAIGLPEEGIPKRRLGRLYPNLDSYHFIFGRGMISDDTEHTCMVAQSMVEAAGDVDEFQKTLARHLKRWLLLLPAGTGIATIKSILRLLIGISPTKSGVFSAGNGPAMRSAIIGVCYGSDPEKMRELVRVSTRMTHTDPKAEYGAVAVALAAHWSAKNARNPFSPREYHKSLAELLGDEAKELLDLIESAVKSAENYESTGKFAESIGCRNGVSGYVYQTVPVTLHSWFSHPSDLRKAVIEVVRCGGDTDTTAAIVGGIVGAGVGIEGIPREWMNGLTEWPRCVNWMHKLGNQLAEVCSSGKPQPPMPISTVATLLRNIFFLIIVLLHGFRRLLPPF